MSERTAKIEKAVDPKHYQSTLRVPAKLVQKFIDPDTGDFVLQYIEIMEFIMTPEEFVGHLKGNIFKYLLRLGQKDLPEQEAKKSSWYGKYLANYFGRS